MSVCGQPTLSTLCSKQGERDVCFSYINSEVTPRKPKPDNLYDDGPDKARAQAKRRGA